MSLIAAASPWVEGHRSRVRLLDAGAQAGAPLAAVEIVLDAGFKTYWRTPGDSGVPPALDWSRSANVAAVEPLWPAPVRFEDAGGASFGYHDRLILPLRVTPGDASRPARLALSVDYGVCKDICIPAHAELTLALSGSGSPPPAVAAALARVPTRRPIGADDALAIVSVEPQPGGSLKVAVRAPAGEAPTLFPEAPDNWYLAAGPLREDAPGAGRSGSFLVEVAQRPREAAGAVALRFTLAAGDQVIESETRLDAALLSR